MPEESPTSFEESEKPRHKVEVFPMGDASLLYYEKLHREDPKSVEMMKDVVYTIMDHAIENTQIFKSEKSKAEMPYAILSLKKIAEDIYVKNGGKLPGSAEESEGKKMEFIMSSFQSTAGGNQFGYIELALHQIIKSLPKALKDLEAGKLVEDYEIYMMGAPTNVMGEMSEKFADQMRENPIGAMGEIYAELAAREIDELKPEQKNKTSMTFTGISMGSSMAAEAASILLKGDRVTQEPSKEKDVPRLTLDLFVPAALDKSPSRLQVPIGFAAEAIHKVVTEPEGARKVISDQKEFLEKMYKALPKEINIKMNDEQAKRKKSAINSLRMAVIKGSQLPKNIKTNEIIGIYDPLMFSFERKKEAQKKREERKGSLGESIMERKNKDEREFAVKMTHRIPFFRENEFKRWDALVKTLTELKKSGSA